MSDVNLVVVILERKKTKSLIKAETVEIKIFVEKHFSYHVFHHNILYDRDNNFSSLFQKTQLRKNETTIYLDFQSTRNGFGRMEVSLEMQEKNY